MANNKCSSYKKNQVTTKFVSKFSTINMCTYH